MPLLDVADLKVSYGKALAIESVSIRVEKGELVGVLGPNGAGKTTLLKAISRSIASSGTLAFKGQSLHGIEPYNVVARGICHCPEGRKLFSELSVLKNLQLGAWVIRRERARVAERLERAFAAFPRLRERRRRRATALSGGEAKMLSLAKELVTNPALILVDEPSAGLAPRIVGRQPRRQLFDVHLEVDAKLFIHLIPDGPRLAA